MPQQLDRDFNPFEMLADALTLQADEPNLLGYKPHEKQCEFHKSLKDEKLFIGGNRSGKSVAGVIEDLWWITKRHPFRQLPKGKIRGRIVVTDFVSGFEQAILPIIKRWIVPSDLIDGSWEKSWNNQKRTLTLANGSFLEIKSSDQDLEKHAGTSRHFIHFDEEPPQAIFNENLLRLVDTNGAWWITMTPVSGMTWVYDVLYQPEKPKPGLLIVIVHMDDNPFLTAEGKAKILSYLDDDERQAREAGSFMQKGGTVFKNFIAGHPYVVSSWKPPSPEWRVYMSVDHGINNPTAILWHAVAPTGQVVTFHEYYAEGKIIEDHCNYIKEYEARNHIYPEIRTGDPAMKQRNGVTGTSIIQAYSERGIYLAVEGVPREVKIGLDRMLMYLKIRAATNAPTWVITQDCPNLIREMRRYHWKSHSSSKMSDKTNALQEPAKKDDHAIDSTRYFFTLMPDLAPDPLDKPVQSFSEGSLLNTMQLMQTPPPDMHRPVEMNWDIRYSNDFGSEYEYE